MGWSRDVRALNKTYGVLLNQKKVDKILLVDVIFDLRNIIEKNRKVTK